MITRENYEIWFIDYADGNLSAGDKVMVEEFLSRNPDLQTELQAYQSMSVQKPEKIAFQYKNELKRSDESMPRINLQNYNEFVVLEMDDELSELHQPVLNQFYMNHPEVLIERQAYLNTRLIPDTGVVYKGKRKLRKGAVVRPIWYISPLAAAASVALFLWLNGPAENLNLNEKPAVAMDEALQNAGKLLAEVDSAQTKEPEDKLNNPVKNSINTGNNSVKIAVAPVINNTIQLRHDKYVSVDRNDVAVEPKKVMPLVNIDSLSPLNHPEFQEITDPGNNDDVAVSTDNAVDSGQKVNQMKSSIDLTRRNGIYELAARGITGLTGQTTELIALEDEKQKEFRFRMGNFEFSRKKSR
jgi:hypothetical protein